MIVEGIKIKGVTCDYQKVEPGYAYVSLKEIAEENSLEIQEAITRGAALIYTEKMDSVVASIPIKRVDNGKILLSKLCNVLYNYPSEKMKFIGICGSNGKTTTLKMLHHIFQNQNRKVAAIDILEEIGEKRIENKREHDFIEEFYHTLDKLMKNHTEIVILELPSCFTSYELFTGLCFDMLIYLTLEKEEMELEVSLQKKALELLPSGGVVLLNMDDSENIGQLVGLENKMVITYGLCSRATITSSSMDASTTLNYCLQRSITTKSDCEIEPMEIMIPFKMRGRHNVHNVLAAVSAALIYDVAPEVIVKAFKEFQGVKRRMEIINHPNFTVIDNYSHNSIGYEAIFEEIQGMDYNNLFIINAIRGGKGVELNRTNAQVLSQWFKITHPKRLITTCSTEAKDKNHSVLEEEREVYLHTLKENQIDFIHEDELHKALKIAIDSIKSNDLILLLGAQEMDQGASVLHKLVQEEKF